MTDEGVWVECQACGGSGDPVHWDDVTGFCLRCGGHGEVLLFPQYDEYDEDHENVEVRCS